MPVTRCDKWDICLWHMSSLNKCRVYVNLIDNQFTEDTGCSDASCSPNGKHQKNRHPQSLCNIISLPKVMSNVWSMLYLQYLSQIQLFLTKFLSEMSANRTVTAIKGPRCSLQCFQCLQYSTRYASRTLVRLHNTYFLVLLVYHKSYRSFHFK